MTYDVKGKTELIRKRGSVGVWERVTLGSVGLNVP